MATMQLTRNCSVLFNVKNLIVAANTPLNALVRVSQ